MTTMRPLLDSSDSDLDRVLLTSGLDEVPPPRTAERTLTALGLGSAVVLGAASTTSVVGSAASVATATKLPFGMLMAKVIGGLAIVGLAAGGGYALVHDGEDAAPKIETANASVTDDGPIDSISSPSSDAVERLAASGAIPSDSVTPSIVAPAQATSLATGAHSAGVDESSKEARDASVTHEKTRKANVSVKPSPERSAAPPERSERATGRSEPAAAEPSVGTSLGAESALIDQARRAELAGDRAACLSRLAAYKARFPKGQLAQDAAAIKCGSR